MKFLRFVGIIAFIYCSFTLIAQTTVTCPVTGTASVYSGFPNSNFSGLAVGDYDNEEFKCLIVFDLSAIPQNSDILDAEMRLTYCQQSDWIGVDLHRISSSWSASSVTWNNFPNYITNPYGTFWTTNGTIGYSIYIPVDEIVEEWIENGEPNWGILLKKSGGTGMAEFFAINASPEYKPELMVTYEVIQPPQLFIDPLGFNLGTHPAGYPINESFIVKNIGGGTLTGTIDASAVFFITSISPTSFSLGADEQITVIFLGAFPSSPGSFDEVIYINSNAVNQTLSVYGTVSNPPTPNLYVDPTNINLGTHAPGYSIGGSFMVKNTGNGTLTGTIFESLEWITSLSQYSFSLGANEYDIVTFSGSFPSSTGNFGGDIEVNSNGGNDDVYVHGVVSVEPLPAPTNLEATVNSDDVHLTWNAPGDELWIQWDNGENASAIGLTNGGTFSVASHWENADLTNYDGYILSKISFFPNDENATYILKVWTGPNGTTEVLSQALTTFNVGDWNEVDLDNPVAIDASTDFWFGYETTHLAGNYPAGCADGPAIQGKGDMILTGGSWESLYVLTGGALDYNWNLAGWISMFDGETTYAQPMVKENALAYNNGSFTAISTGTVKAKAFNPAGSKYLELLGYNVYRDDVKINTSLVLTKEYDDLDLLTGQYEYYVTAVWDEVESDPSNTIIVDIPTGVNEINMAGVMIYPNPVVNLLNIKADAEIINVELMNLMGQRIIIQKVNELTYQINIADLQSGIYIVKIQTSKGIITRKIIIQH